MWRYTLRDLTPDDDPETWARDLADEGWRMWIPGNNGADTIIGGRHVRRYSLRKWTGKGPEPAGSTTLAHEQHRSRQRSTPTPSQRPRPA